MVYKIDADEDRKYIEEFRRLPIGEHSPGLQRLLTIMRLDAGGWQHVLVCRKPFAEFVIGLMPPNRADPIQIEDGPVFASREEAEWEIFRRRWQQHTGEDINIGLHD